MSLATLQHEFVHPEFDRFRTFACHLQVGMLGNRLAYVVTNIHQTLVLVFKEFIVVPDQPFLHDIALQHEEISRFFKSVRVWFGNMPYSLVPSPFFSESNARELYQLNLPISENTQVVHQQWDSAQFTSLFPVDSTLYQHFRSFFQAFTNLTDPGILQHYRSINPVPKEELQADILLYADHIVLNLYQGLQLLLSNRYPVSNIEESLYFVANAAEQHKLELSRIKISLGGDPAKVKALTLLLEKYTGTVSELTPFPTLDTSSDQ